MRPYDEDEEFDDPYAATIVMADNLGEDMYDESLNNIYGSIDIAGTNYHAAEIFKGLNAADYRTSFLEWKDSGARRAIEQKLNAMQIDGSATIYGMFVECFDEDECEECPEDESEDGLWATQSSTTSGLSAYPE
jgi:hypothetical protein